MFAGGLHNAPWIGLNISSFVPSSIVYYRDVLVAAISEMFVLRVSVA
jgi:hypothetical protein